MLLVVDVGNTNIVLGTYRSDEQLTEHWRISTDRLRTTDEYGGDVERLVPIGRHGYR